MRVKPNIIACSLDSTTFAALRLFDGGWALDAGAKLQDARSAALNSVRVII